MAKKEPTSRALPQTPKVTPELLRRLGIRKLTDDESAEKTRARRALADLRDTLPKRRGRPPIAPDKRSKQFCVTLYPEDHARLLIIGEGSLSRGVRVAIAAERYAEDLGGRLLGPDTMAEIYEGIRSDLRRYRRRESGPRRVAPTTRERNARVRTWEDAAAARANREYYAANPDGGGPNGSKRWDGSPRSKPRAFEEDFDRSERLPSESERPAILARLEAAEESERGELRAALEGELAGGGRDPTWGLSSLEIAARRAPRREGKARTVRLPAAPILYGLAPAPRTGHKKKAR